MRKTKWKMSVFTKLLATLLATSFVPLAIGLYFVAQFLIRYETDNYIEIMQANLTQANFIIKERVELLKQSATDLARNSGVLALLEDVTASTSDVQLVDTLRHRTLPAVQNSRLSNKYAASIRLIHGNPRVYDVYDLLCYDASVLSGGWKDRLASSYLDDGDPLSVAYVGPIGPAHDYFGYGPADPGRELLSVFASVLSRRDNALLGVIEASMDLSVLTAPLTDVPVNSGEILQMVDRENRAIYTSAPDFAYMPVLERGHSQGAEFLWEGRRYRIFFQRVSSIDAWLVQYIPVSIAGIEKYKYVIGSMIMIASVIFALMSVSLYELFSANIRKLIHGINRVKAGDLNTRIEIRTNDELGEISAHFNEMTARLRDLVRREKLAGKLEKQAIYKALESQMKPHFLCNALDFIRMSTQAQGNEEIARSIGLIMEYFNYNMNRKHMTVSIQDELRNVEDFIGIYNLINHNRIEYTIDIVPDLVDELKRRPIIKYALQPIVENAVKHAFYHKKGECFISLEIEYVAASFGQAISIGIEDNGGGMEASQVESLSQAIRGDEGQWGQMEDRVYQGIGLRNIYQRMRLAYGESCDLQIESYPQLGTKISVLIPPLSFDDKEAM